MYYKNRKYVPSKKWFIYSIEIIPKFAHLEPQMDALTISLKFNKWLNNFDPTQITLYSVTITDIDWFSCNQVPDPLRLGFVKCSSEAYDFQTGKKIVSNISFITGDSVAILIVVKVIDPIINKKNKEYVLLCEQHRLPIGKKTKEICSGMMETEGNILSVSLQEVKEETGFNIKSTKDLIELGKVYTTPGGCDEVIRLFAWATTISQAEFIEKENKMYGCAEGNKEIKLSFVELNEFKTQTIYEIGDIKAECAFYRFLEKRKRKFIF